MAFCFLSKENPINNTQIAVPLPTVIEQPSFFPDLSLESLNPHATSKPKFWLPDEVFFTRSALREAYGKAIYSRLTSLNLPITELNTDRLPSLCAETQRDIYRRAKQTLAIVTAPQNQLKLQPIPPSADYQFHLAQGCPAHCQYCYLAGSLSGPPVTRVYANLPDILRNLENYKTPGKVTTFEASCYTDPLSLEHPTGSLSATIKHFGEQDGMALRWVSKFDNVEPLLHLEHNGNTRARISMNALPITQRAEFPMQSDTRAYHPPLYRKVQRGIDRVVSQHLTRYERKQTYKKAQHFWWAQICLHERNHARVKAFSRSRYYQTFAKRQNFILDVILTLKVGISFCPPSHFRMIHVY
ncbi:MAG: spore photoproduct lyase family protein [Trueperaceae bacterium]